MAVFSPTEKSYIWLDSFPLEDSEKRKLLALAGSAVALVKDFPRFQETLIKWGKESVYNNMSCSLSDGGQYFQTLLSNFQQQGITPLPFGATLYPSEWSNLTDAPLVVYAKGDATLLKERKFTIVGSRRTTASALKIGAKLAEELTQAFTIVTGVADGGDTAAIEGGLKGGGRVICVTAGGFSALPQGNLSLLKRVAEQGLLLSPYPYDTPVRAYSYEYRNKLLAALSEATLVLGADEKSGSLITAKYAKEYHKKLFALPYAPGVYAGVGCNALIKQGALLTETSADVFSAFGIEPKSQASLPPLTQDETQILELLKTLSVAHVTELSNQSGMPMYKTNAILSSLEVKGLIVKAGGNRYEIV